MDLKTFIADTLTQIIGGISEAQRNISAMDVNAAVNPASISSDSRRHLTGARPVEFDVALTVLQRSAVSAADGSAESSGIVSVVQSFSEARSHASEDETHSEEAVSRVRFSVMLAQPGDIDVYPSSNMHDRMAEMGRQMG